MIFSNQIVESSSSREALLQSMREYCNKSIMNNTRVSGSNWSPEFRNEDPQKLLSPKKFSPNDNFPFNFAKSLLQSPKGQEHYGVFSHRNSPTYGEEIQVNDLSLHRKVPENYFVSNAAITANDSN